MIPAKTGPFTIAGLMLSHYEQDLDAAQETTPFTATVHSPTVGNIGHLSNEGRGGQHVFTPLRPEHRALWAEAANAAELDAAAADSPEERTQVLAEALAMTGFYATIMRLSAPAGCITAADGTVTNLDAWRGVRLVADHSYADVALATSRSPLTYFVPPTGSAWPWAASAATTTEGTN